MIWNLKIEIFWKLKHIITIIVIIYNMFLGSFSTGLRSWSNISLKQIIFELRKRSSRRFGLGLVEMAIVGFWWQNLVKFGKMLSWNLRLARLYMMLNLIDSHLARWGEIFFQNMDFWWFRARVHLCSRFRNYDYNCCRFTMLLHYALLVSSIAFYCYLLLTCMANWQALDFLVRGGVQIIIGIVKKYLYVDLEFQFPTTWMHYLSFATCLLENFWHHILTKKNNSRDSFRSWESCKKRRSNGSRRSWRFRRRKRSKWTLDRCNAITQGDKNQRRCDNADFLWCNVTML